MKIPFIRLTTVTNFIVLSCSFVWISGDAIWVDTADDNLSFRDQPSCSHFHKESASCVSKDRQKQNAEQLHGSKTVWPYSTPVSPPTAAPTAAPSSFVDRQSDRDDHNDWLLEQQKFKQGQQYGAYSADFSSTSTAATSSTHGKGVLPNFLSRKSLEAATRSFFGSAKAYTNRVYHESPTAFWVSSSSIGIFIAWQLLPAIYPILMQFFLASRQSAMRSLGLSLVLSAVSHKSFRHLLVNLLVFLNLSPVLTAIRVPSSSWASNARRGSASQQYAGLSKTALWPFLLGGALSGNLLFLLFRPQGSCLGLSGVTCAMLGAYAAAVPDRIMRIMLYGVVPVSLRTGTLVQFLFLISLAGSVFMPSSQICHLGHLGGLLFGVLYYQNVMVAGSKQKFPTNLLRKR